MVDIFERIQGYENQEQEAEKWRDWTAYRMIEMPDSDWSCIAPEDENDPRRFFVGEYLFAEKGIAADDTDAIQAVLAENREILAKIEKAVSQQYICTADYCALQEIKENSKIVGFDVLLRYAPLQSLADDPNWTALFEKEDDAQETEFSKAVADLMDSLGHALLELEQIGLPYGHLGLSHILLDKRTGKTKFLLDIPGRELLLRSAEKDRRDTDEYHAPELLDETQPFDCQTDLYALDLLMYQAMNDGKMPFETDGKTTKEAVEIRSAGSTEIPNPAHGNQLLQYIVRKALAFQRKYRYASAKEFLDDLEWMDTLDTLPKQYHPDIVCTVSEDAQNVTLREYGKRNRSKVNAIINGDKNKCIQIAITFATKLLHLLEKEAPTYG
ncbi:MAG: hypothetical protein LUC50_02385 [Ruminococcus sp.]|nr:hypothetical protein [Ruminococcus sp.]